MANEATIRSTLQILKGNLDYRSNPAQFTANVDGTKGPSPGAVTATTDGTDVDLSELDIPSLCRIQNIDSTNYVEVGMWDPEIGVFFPILELLPGETYVVRLSRNIQGEYVGTGTSPGPTTNRLRVKSNTADCVVLVEAFEK